jgi:hypothetical protein
VSKHEKPTMSHRATCPRCGAAFRLCTEGLGKPIRCSNCQTVFLGSDRRLAKEADGPRQCPVQQRGVPIGVLVAAVGAALLIGITLAGGAAYFYLKPQTSVAVAELPPGHSDDVPGASRGPKPPNPTLSAERHDSQRVPNGTEPQKPAVSLPPQPDDKLKPSGQQPNAKVNNKPFEDWDPGLALPNLSGWVMLPDGDTLIVALPDEATLVYIDTDSNKESKRIKLSFKPDCLAVQGKRLFASAQGVSAVHVLDVESGVDRKEINVPDGFVTAIACHPQKGPVYLILSEQHTIYTLDPERNSTALAGFNGLVPFKFPAPHYRAIRARAQYLAIDPRTANAFYTTYASGVDKWHEGIRERTYGQGLEKYLLRAKVALYPGDLPGQRTTISVPAGPFQPLERLEVNANAVPVTGDLGGFYPVRVSSDGKRVGIIGRGEIQMLEADNINSGAGVAKCPSPSDLAFHPVLDQIAVEGSNGPSGRAVYLFDAKSLTQISKISFDSGPAAKSPPAGRLLTFGGHGTKVVYYDWSHGGCLRFLSVKLTPKDREMLSKAYSVEIKPFTVQGAIEGECLKVLGKSIDFSIDAQDMTAFGNYQWSGDRQIWGRATKNGDWADLELPAPADGKHNVIVYLTRSWDYGIVQFHLNGAKLGNPLDCYHTDTVVNTGPIDLGEANLKKGANTLRVEIVGSNPKTANPHYSWGLDCIVLKHVP